MDLEFRNIMDVNKEIISDKIKSTIADVCTNENLDFNGMQKNDVSLNIDDNNKNASSSEVIAIENYKTCSSAEPSEHLPEEEAKLSNGSLQLKPKKNILTISNKTVQSIDAVYKEETSNSLSSKADKIVVLCRVCMQSNDVLISMFEKCPSESFFAPQSEMRQPDKVTEKASIWYDDQTICDKIKFCSSVQVLESEELSSVICKSCLSDLLIAYRFKKRLEDSDELFRKRLGLKNKTIVKTEFVLINCDASDDGSDCSLDEGSNTPSRKKRKLRNKNKPSTKMKVDDVYSADDDDNKWPDKYKYKCEQCDRSFQYPSVLKLHEGTHYRENKRKTKAAAKEITKTPLPAKNRGRILVTPPPTKMKKRTTRLLVTPPPTEVKGTTKPLFDPTSDTLTVKDEDVVILEDSEQLRESLKCNHCDRVFDKLRGLKLHEKSHTREKKHACEDCSERFGNAINLHIHRREMHTMRKCPKCGRIFKNRLSFVKHVESHNSDKIVVKKTIVEQAQVKSNTDLFKSIAPLTTTYWSDSYSD